MKNGSIIMSKRQQFKLDLVVKVSTGVLDRETACLALGVSERTLRRYLKAYREIGISFVVHGNSGRAPSNKTPDSIKDTVMNLYRSKYFDFNMAHGLEKINEELDLDIKREVFRRWCQEDGCVTRKKKRRGKIRVYRPRQRQAGMLIQMDGSYHKWFGNKMSCLIIAVDDATGEIVSGGFYSAEKSEYCLEVLKELVGKRGAFNLLYVDKAGVFGGVKRSGFSQVERALSEVGTKVLYANSPQAKGRVERIFRTLQDRLIPELRLAKIKSQKKANDFFKKKFIPDHYNQKFVHSPEIEIPAYRKLSKMVDLDSIFCVKEYRKVAKDHTISLFGEKYLIDTEALGHSIAGQTVSINLGNYKPKEVNYGNYSLPLVPIKKYKSGQIAA